MTRRTIAAAPVLCCVLPCVGRADDPPRLRVFYTGHSFHMFVPGRVALTAKAAGVKEYQLAGTQGIGGSKVIQHWDKDKGDNQARKALETFDTPYTPAHTLIRALRASLKRIVGEGMENLFIRQKRYAAAARAASRP